MNKLKTCTKCYIEKPIRDFYIVKSVIQRVCKSCTLQYMKTYNQTYKQKLRIKIWNEKARSRRLKKVVTMQNCKRIKGYQCKCGTILLDFPKDLTENFACPKCSIILATIKMVKSRK